MKKVKHQQAYFKKVGTYLNRRLPPQHPCSRWAGLELNPGRILTSYVFVSLNNYKHTTESSEIRAEMMLEEKGSEMEGRIVLDLVKDERKGAREEECRANRRQLIRRD